MGRDYFVKANAGSRVCVVILPLTSNEFLTKKGRAIFSPPNEPGRKEATTKPKTYNNRPFFPLTFLHVSAFSFTFR